VAGRGDRPGRVPGRGPGLPLERLELAGGQGRAEPASSAPDASADIRGLASLFTGFAGPDDLVRAGLLSGFDPEGLDLLRAAFASPRPWTAEFY
jgi:predicted acetyltransferase